MQRHSDGATRSTPSPGESPTPCSPEEAFVAWLLWLPDGRDPRLAARAELVHLDRRAPLAPAARRLRAMLATLAANDSRTHDDRAPNLPPGVRAGRAARRASRRRARGTDRTTPRTPTRKP